MNQTKKLRVACVKAACAAFVITPTVIGALQWMPNLAHAPV